MYYRVCVVVFAPPQTYSEAHLSQETSIYKLKAEGGGRIFFSKMEPESASTPGKHSTPELDPQQKYC